MGSCPSACGEAMTEKQESSAGSSVPLPVPELLGQLRQLTHAPGFIYSLAQVAVTDLFLTPEDAATVDWSARLSFQELTLATGLAVTRHIDTAKIPGKAIAENQIEHLRHLLSQLHESYWRSAVDRIEEGLEALEPGEDPGPKLASVFSEGQILVEPMFYEGSGAFDFQYLEMAQEKYRLDSDWLKANVGLSIELMTEAAAKLKELQVQRVEGYRNASTHHERCLAALATFSFTRQDLDFMTEDEFDSFVGKFALAPGTVKQSLTVLGDLNLLDFRPIIKLGQQGFFLPVTFTLARSIYESPFYWMTEDSTYGARLSENRGDATEAIAHRLLETVFEGRVYRNVAVRDGRRNVTEIDVLALAGNRAIIVQAKSKRLTQESRRGNDDRLRSDFQDAVQAPYDQGLASRRALLTRAYELTDTTGKPIDLPETIEDVYLICLTLDHYPALPHMIDGLLKKHSSDPYPVAISVFELDVLATYLADPFEFLYYIRNRVKWADRITASSEMALLGHHLNEKLYLPVGADRVGVDESFAQLVDANFPVIRGHQPPTTGANQLWSSWRNREFDLLVSQVRDVADTGFTDALFMLYDLHSDAADDLMKQIDEVRLHCSRTGQVGNITKLMGDYGISYICFPRRRTDNWLNFAVHAKARKYRSRAHGWLGLGGVVDSPSRVEMVAYNGDPWQPDPHLDKLARSTLKGGTARFRGGRKPGRNEPCFCGSGKKFKKCHESVL